MLFIQFCRTSLFVIFSVCLYLINHSHNAVSNISPDHASNHVNVNPPQLNYQLAAFIPATVDEVRKIILFSPPIILKVCLDYLINLMTTIVKASLCSGMFPDQTSACHPTS